MSRYREKAAAVVAQRQDGRHPTALTATPPSRDAVGVLDLQQKAGNRAVVTMLQRDTARRAGPAPAPARVPSPTPTLNQDSWKSAQEGAVKAVRERKDNAYQMYSALLSDAATTAGLGDLPGFDPTKISPTDGETAKPGLNLSVDPQDKPGHTGWIDESGNFGVPLNVAAGPPKVQVGIIINAQAMTPDKARAVAVVRHEMMHAKHHILTLDAIRRWHKAGRKKSLDSWVDANAAKLRLTEVDRVLIKKGALDLAANTEVLAYVEGFITQYHAAEPTKSGAAFAFFELLGAVQTDRLFTWQQADKAVKGEAMGRLRSYFGTLDRAHQELWRVWVREQVAANVKDTTGRKDFLNQLATFVR